MKIIKDIINAFTKSQFSKKIVVISTILFVATYIANILITLLTTGNIDTILDYAQTQFFFCFGGYAFKTIPENWIKIKTGNSNTAPTETTSNETTAQG